jgi:mono/diheme cytochrome c family protein
MASRIPKHPLVIMALVGITACVKPEDRNATPPPGPNSLPSATTRSPAAPAAANSTAAPASAPQPAANGDQAAAQPAGGGNGPAVFARTCQTCHQANGQGMPNAFPPLAGSPIVQGDKAKFIRLVLRGLQGPITVEGKKFNGMMPPQGSLSDADLAAVMTYERSNFGNHADAVTAAEVARERTATASHTGMWTAAELGIH